MGFFGHNVYLNIVYMVYSLNIWYNKVAYICMCSSSEHIHLISIFRLYPSQVVWEIPRGNKDNTPHPPFTPFKLPKMRVVLCRVVFCRVVSCRVVSYRVRVCHVLCYVCCGGVVCCVVTFLVVLALCVLLLCCACLLSFPVLLSFTLFQPIQRQRPKNRRDKICFWPIQKQQKDNPKKIQKKISGQT